MFQPRGGIYSCEVNSAAKLCTLLLCLQALGCEAFDASLLEEVDAATCDLNRPPPRPTEANDGDDGETYFFAVRDLKIDQRDDRWATIGYDLDGICSEQPLIPVECRAPAAAAPLSEDGVRGTDNALGKDIIPLLLISFNMIEEELRMIQTQGTGVTLIQITGWNGEDDDPRVEAVLSQSIFGTSEDPGPFDAWSIAGSELRIDGELHPQPSWDGNDLWWAREDNYLDEDPTKPRVRDDNAYIADRTVVMTLPDRFPIIFGGDMRSAQFFLTDVTATISIAPDKQSVERMIIAGRFSIIDLLSIIGSTGVCPGTDDYRSFERLLELAADIRSTPGTGGPDVSCDALSVGLLYESGTRAEFGGIAVGLGIPDPCMVEMDGGVGDGGMDGGMDSAMGDGGTDAGADTGADTGPLDTGVSDASGDADGGVPDATPDA